MDSTTKRRASIDNMPPESTTMKKPPANINTMPLEVTTTIVRLLYRDAVIELDEIESLARLGQIATTGQGEVATTKKALAMLKSGIMSEDLATRLMFQEAIFKFDCRMNIFRIDLVRIPKLCSIQRLHIDMQHLNFPLPFTLLSNLPALEEVTVLSKSDSYWSDIRDSEAWIAYIDNSIPTFTAHNPMAVWPGANSRSVVGYVTMGELTNSQWKFDLFFSAEYWQRVITGYKGGRAQYVSFLVCKVVISKGKIVEFLAVAPVGMDWKEDLIVCLGLNN